MLFLPYFAGFSLFSAGLEPPGPRIFSLEISPSASSMQAEKYLLFGRQSSCDGRVESVDHRRGELEMANDRGCDVGLEGGGSGQGRAQSPLAVLDEVERRMIAGEALGRTGQRGAV